MYSNYVSPVGWRCRRTLYRVSIISIVWTLVFWNVVITSAERHRGDRGGDDPYFVVSTVDGSIGILKAMDGTVVGGFRSGTPLVGPSDVLNGGQRIVPGLDGRLYVSLEHQDGLLPLEITVLDVLQSPVKTCKEQNCGIVTATKSTSLFALDARTGRLVWKQSPNGTTIIEEVQEHDPIVTSTVLLQREDVLVQQLSTDSGESVWNVTLGTVQALEFGEANRGSESLPMGGTGSSSSGGGAYLPSGDSRQVLMHDYYHPVELPCIVFGPDGTTLMAVTPTQTDQVTVLWRRDFPTVVASVFGLQGKTWKPLTVLEDPTTSGNGDRGDKPPQLGGEPSPSRSLLTVYQPPVLQRLYQFWTRPMSLLDRLAEDWFLATGQQPRRRHYVSSGASSSSRRWPSLEHNPHQVALPRKHTLAPLYDHHDLFAPPPPRRTLALPSSPLFEDYDSRHGVFLTWPILVGICIVVVGVAALVFRFLYLQKKTKWIMLLQRIAPGENQNPDEAGGNHTHNTNTNAMNAVATSTLKRSHSLPDVGGTIQPFPRRHRSESLQINYAIPDDNRVMDDKDLQEKETLATEGNTASQNINNNSNLLQPQPPPPPLPEQQTQGVGFLIDGIPLIRYNRYDSEFTEVVALGKGGFGTVFRCKNVLDGREYAIKKVSLKYKEGLPLEEFRQRLQRTLREVKSLALLDHPNIVRYYTAWLELQQQQQQQDENDETRKSSQQLADSEYYLFSPTAYTDKSHHNNHDLSIETTESRYHHQRPNGYQHSTNPFMAWNGLNNHSSTNEPSFEPLVPGIPEHLDDYGFTFDRDDENDDYGDDHVVEEKDNVTDWNHVTTTEDKPKSLGFLAQSPLVHRYSSNYSTNSAESSIEGSTTAGWPRESRNSTQHHHHHGSTTETPTEERDLHQAKTPTIMVKHILYIQMQFCSQKTLADFLSNADARKGGETSGKVDIPYALSLFLQIAQGVQHVHSQGLIHRDLKPNNCFIDDSGAVKVGDFGLSRESANDNRDGLDPVEEMVLGGNNILDNDNRGDPKCYYASSLREITAGVGTRSYASPEQMKGSDYDSSTDIYSLGIILFELCYPMYTGMERTIVLSKLREHIFPDPWMETVRPAFPTLHTLLQSMISNSPADRPSAEVVVRSIQTILEGFTISSIDKQHHENAILLRVEAKPRDDVLRHTMKLVEEAASPESIEIVQYGLRGGTNKAVMEFAIAASTCKNRTILGNTLVDRLDKCEEVLLIRQVSGTKYTYAR